MNVVPPMVKTKFCSLEKLELEILRRPVALSSVAPVALWYFWKASVAVHQTPRAVFPKEMTLLTRCEVEESGSSVDNTSSGGRNSCGTVLHRLVDTPIE